MVEKLSMIASRFVLLALVLASCAKHGERSAEPELDEWIRVIDNPFENSQLVRDDYTHIVTQVVDARTGALIPGATLSRVELHSWSQKTLPVYVERDETDEFGIARISADSKAFNWCYVEAPGYAPSAAWRIGDFPVRLERGVDVRVRIFDSLGRPARGVYAQYYLGAGDGPNSRQPLSDSDGYVTLRCIDLGRGVLFLVGSGVAGGDIDVAKIPPFDGVRYVHSDPGIVVDGQVLDAQGAPIAGACVGARTWYHGPWTQTDRDGRFRLPSVTRFDDIAVFANSDAKTPLAEVTIPPPGVPIVIRTGVAEESTVDLEIALVNRTRPASKPGDVEVCVTRLSDGWTTVGDTGAGGVVVLSVPAGRWDLLVGGEVGPFVQRRLSVEVRADGTSAVTIALDLWPAVRVDGTKLDDDPLIWISTAHDQRALSDDEVNTGLVHLPRDRDLSLRVSPGWESAAGYPGGVVRVSKGANLDGGLKLAAPSDWNEPSWFPQSMQTDEKETDNDADDDDADDDDADDDDADDAHDAAGTLTVLDPQGRPVGGAWVRTSHGNSHEARYTDESGQVFAGPAGALVEVQADRESGFWTPLRTRLEGDGPWTLQFGKAAVRIEVRNEQGERIDWWGLFPDGDAAWGVDEDVELYGLKPGLYRILACAPMSRGVVRQFRLVEGEVRAMRLVLPSNPR